jgi:membrane protease YdiL (CAAX protease family)
MGQLIASLIFGLFHILHAPVPNWRYVILASIAGWFYGAAYRSGGTLFSSILVHATVDTVWRAFLTRS